MEFEGVRDRKGMWEANGGKGEGAVGEYHDWFEHLSDDGYSFVRHVIRVDVAHLLHAYRTLFHCYKPTP